MPYAAQVLLWVRCTTTALASTPSDEKTAIADKTRTLAGSEGSPASTRVESDYKEFFRACFRAGWRGFLVLPFCASPAEHEWHEDRFSYLDYIYIYIQIVP